MSQKLLQAVAQNTRLRIVGLLKRSDGLSIPALAESLSMSYMGAKDACLDLEKQGLLEGRREPKAVGTTGRPRLVYRLTSKAHGLFPTTSNALTLALLESAKRLYGPAAAEKLLLVTWQDLQRRYEDQIRGTTLAERVAALVRIRDRDGHMARMEAEPAMSIIEHHCPFLDLLRAYPLVAKLETEAVSGALKVPVERLETEVGGLLRIEFRLPQSSPAPV
jgi:predicted ArsR family transcriptional regulator